MQAPKNSDAIRSVSHLLKSFKSKPKPKPEPKNVDAEAEAAQNSCIYDAAFSTTLFTRAYDFGETYYDYEDSSGDDILENVLVDPWFAQLSPKLSLSNKDHARKERSRERKNKFCVIKKESQKQSHCFRRLVKLCGSSLGLVQTLTMFDKLGRETGMKEYKALLALNVERARETDDHQLQTDLNYKAFEVFRMMTEMSLPIQEDIYGPFLKYLIDKDMVEEFYFFYDIFISGKSASQPRLAYYEMLLCIRLNNEDKIKELIYEHSLYDGGDKELFQESYLLALGGSDCKREFCMLLETFDVIKASSEERLGDIFKLLGILSLEAYAQKFLLELKTSGAESATLTNYIYDYASNIPNFEVEDGGSKFKQLHCEMEMKPTSTHYEKLIRHFCKLLKVHVAIDLADEMFNVGSTTSLETIHTMLDACMESYEYDMVHRIHSMIRHQGLKPNSETFRSLISLTVRLKDFNGAYGMLREMAEMNIARTSTIYNTIMAAHLSEKNIHGALAIVNKMKKENVKADSQTFSYLIRSCNSGEQIDEILHVMKQSCIQVTKHVEMALINALAACGEFERAKQVILGGLVPVKNPNRMKSVLVSALARHGKLSDALTIYEEIKQAGCSLAPKDALYLIGCLHSAGQLDILLQLQQELQDSKYFIDGCYRVSVYCIRHNHLSSAVELLKKIRDKFADDEVAAENIFDEVFSEFVNQKPKDMKFGLELLRAIKEEIGLRPSRNVLDFLLDACVSADDLNSAFYIWKEYQVVGLPYNILSFLRMYRTILALGAPKSAEEYLKKIRQDDPHISYLIKGFQDTYLRASLHKTEKRKKKKKDREKQRKRDDDENNY